MRLSDPEVADPERWAGGLAGLCGAAGGDGYREWFLAAERDGDFEKRAGRGEILAALNGLTASVVDTLGTAARDAIDRDEADRCVRLVKLVWAVAPESADAARAETNVCDRLEDLVVSRSDRLCDELFHGIDWDHSKLDRNASANGGRCRAAAAEVKGSVEPLISALADLAGAGSERMQRLGVPAARMYRNLGLGWQWAKQYHLSELALKRGLQLSVGTPMADKIAADLRDLPGLVRAPQGGRVPRGGGRQRRRAEVLRGVGMGLGRGRPGFGRPPRDRRFVPPAAAGLPDLLAAPDDPAVPARSARRLDEPRLPAGGDAGRVAFAAGRHGRDRHAAPVPGVAGRRAGRATVPPADLRPVDRADLPPGVPPAPPAPPTPPGFTGGRR